MGSQLRVRRLLLLFSAKLQFGMGWCFEFWLCLGGLVGPRLESRSGRGETRNQDSSRIFNLCLKRNTLKPATIPYQRH